MENRYASDLLLTDDGGARNLAGQLNIKVVSTWKLLAAVTRLKWVQCEEMLDHLDLLGNHKRGGPRPSSVGELRQWAGMPPAPVTE